MLLDHNKLASLDAIPYLNKEFLSTLDEVQQVFLIESRLYQKKHVNYRIFEDISEMKEVMTEQNRSLVMRNKDEFEMEQMLIDVMQS